MIKLKTRTMPQPHYNKYQRIDGKKLPKNICILVRLQLCMLLDHTLAAQRMMNQQISRSKLRKLF
jgi:hypothetical protein